MALPIKAVPTLYGEEARSFRLKAEEAERKFIERGDIDMTTDPRYIIMRKILQKSNLE